MTTPHYCLNVPVTREEIEVLKKEFEDYLDLSGGFAVDITPLDDGAEKPSDELQEVMAGLFTRLVSAITFGRFEGVN